MSKWTKWEQPSEPQHDLERILGGVAGQPAAMTLPQAQRKSKKGGRMQELTHQVRTTAVNNRCEEGTSGRAPCDNVLRGLPDAVAFLSGYKLKDLSFPPQINDGPLYYSNPWRLNRSIYSLWEVTIQQSCKTWSGLLLDYTLISLLPSVTITVGPGRAFL